MLRCARLVLAVIAAAAASSPAPALAQGASGKAVITGTQRLLEALPEVSETLSYELRTVGKWFEGSGTYDRITGPSSLSAKPLGAAPRLDLSPSPPLNFRDSLDRGFGRGGAPLSPQPILHDRAPLLER